MRATTDGVVYLLRGPRGRCELNRSPTMLEAHQEAAGRVVDMLK